MQGFNFSWKSERRIDKFNKIVYFTFKRETFLNFCYWFFEQFFGNTLHVFFNFCELGIRHQIQKAAFGVQTKIHLVKFKVIVFVDHVYILDIFLVPKVGSSKEIYAEYPEFFI